MISNKKHTETTGTANVANDTFSSVSEVPLCHMCERGTAPLPLTGDCHHKSREDAHAEAMQKSSTD